MNPKGQQTHTNHSSWLLSSSLFIAITRIELRIAFSQLRSFAFSKKRPKRKTVQQQFVEHCAIAIQSRFRGYLQRKRYRAFLPIYRRVRQLLFALYNGWKIRRIMKLHVMKSHISEVNSKSRNNQASSLRIAKRQFIDDIERLSKKGRWIDILMKARANNACKVSFNGKQNSSLYGNVKSKSIKNIFKQTNAKQMKETYHQESDRSSKLETLRIELPHCNPSAKRTIIEDFDEKPLKTQHTISICDTQSQKGPTLSKRQYLKKGKKDQNVQKGIKTARNVLQRPKQATKQKKIDQVGIKDNSTDIDKANNKLSVSRASKSSQISKQKIHITIADPLCDSVKSIMSLKNLNESTIDMKTMQASTSSLTFEKNKQLLPELIQVYEQKYLREKMNIIQKLVQLPMKYTSASKKRYDSLLLNF